MVDTQFGKLFFGKNNGRIGFLAGHWQHYCVTAFVQSRFLHHTFDHVERALAAADDEEFAFLGEKRVEAACKKEHHQNIQSIHGRVLMSKSSGGLCLPKPFNG
jgi:hypothetical protein